MKAILIDDESLALDYLERLLCKIDGITIEGKFMDSLKAFEAVALIKPDIVFLDVEMPGMNGIEFGEKIKTLKTDIQLIFVTAYSEHAVKAFDLDALDYLVKPVQLDRLERSLARFKPAASSVSSATEYRIRTFQRLAFIIMENGGERELQLKWRTSKVRSVFVYLLLQHGKPVRKDILLEEFWQDLPMDKGYVQLYSCIYQIRKTIASAELDISLANYEHTYQLALDGVSLDSEEWIKQLKLLPELTENTSPLYEQTLSAYSGTFLEEENHSWVDNERERLNLLWFQQMTKLANFFDAEGKVTEAITAFLRIQSVFPYLEANYLSLMKLYKDLGDYHSVRQQFSLLKEMLLEEYGTEPEQSVLQLLQTYLLAE